VSDFGTGNDPAWRVASVHRFHRLMTYEELGGHTALWEVVGCQGAANAHRRNATGLELGCRCAWHQWR